MPYNITKKKKKKVQAVHLKKKKKKSVLFIYHLAHYIFILLENGLEFPAFLPSCFTIYHIIICEEQMGYRWTSSIYGYPQESLVRLSAQRRKRYGNRGSPYCRPLVRIILPRITLLIRTKYDIVEMHCIIKLIHLLLNPIFYMGSKRKNT